MRTRRILLILVVSLTFLWDENTHASWCRSYLENLHYMLTGKVRFEGSQPLDFFESVEPSFYKLPRGSKVHVLTPDERISQPLDSSLAMVKLNSDFEKNLLAYSSGPKEKREVMDIRTFDTSGEELTRLNRPVEGTIGDSQNLSVRLAWLAVPTSSETFLLEIDNVSPRYEYSYSYVKRKNVVSSQSPIRLLEEEEEFVEALSRSQPFFLRMKVILPNGYFYQQTWKDGKPVQDPLDAPKAKHAWGG